MLIISLDFDTVTMSYMNSTVMFEKSILNVTLFVLAGL